MQEPKVPSALDCMHCGFCQQVCPTYLLTGDENESPRGRLFLMRAVDEGRLELDDAVHAHLDHCLDCRACETACPSGVEYGRVLEPFRIRQRKLKQAPKRNWLTKRLTAALPDRKRLRRYLKPAWLAKRIGLASAATALRLDRALPPDLRRMATQLPPAPPEVPPLPELLPASGTLRHRVALFLGCAGEVFTPQVSRASARVLQALGCEVWTPQAQGCCGALAYHEGRQQEAQQHWLALAELFGQDDGPDALILTAAGCGSMLHDLDRVAAELGLDDAHIRRLHDRAVDLHRFLAGLDWSGVSLRPTQLRAVYDPACHLIHAQGIRDEPLELLARVPGLEIVPHAEAELCCGAAGSYVMNQPEFSDAIGARKARAILDSGARAVITANVGCALQIQRCCAALGEDIEVYHPIELLAKSLA